MGWKAIIPILFLWLPAGCATETETPPPPPPILSELTKRLAIDQIFITGYPHVQNATVTQNGRELSLALVVVPETSEAQAKEIGGSFVRLVKSFSIGTNPGQGTGGGAFDFLITVTYPDTAVVAQGAEMGSSGQITW
ncbi:MAG: hypothetical protein V3S82_04035 [Dehalococcoidia bacterium]